MKSLLKSHTTYYLSFAVMMLICLGLITGFAKNPGYRLVVVVLTGLFYAFWGIAHHLVHHDITLKIVLEYILTALLGISLVVLLAS